MASAPVLHATTGGKRLSAVEACRLLAGEIWRREKKLDHFRTGGLNSDKAVRQRLQSIAMEMQRAPNLDEKVALHLHSIRWLDADPLTILERTEGLVDRQCRDGYASVDALVRDRNRATELAIRLLVLQGLAGRMGRWAVRAGEIPDARIARAQYRELRTPEWSQYRKLTEEAAVAFEWADYQTAAAKIFDADRLVRTPATLMTAAVSLSRVADFAGALWAIRVCLLEPEESFESEAALKKARNLETRLRDIVSSRQETPLEAEALLLEGSSEAVAIQPIDVVDEQKDVLETESAALLEHPTPPAERPSDRWGERYLSDEEAAQTPTPIEDRVLVTQKPVVVHKHAEPRPQNRTVFPTKKGVVTVYEVLGPEDRIPTVAKHEDRIPTRPSSPDHQRLIRRERAMYEASFYDDPPSEEVTYVPVGPSEDVSVDDFQDETEIPPSRELEKLREIARRAIAADLVDDPSTDLLAVMTLPMGQHTRETALASLDREENEFSHEAATTQMPAARPSSQPTGKVVLRRTYEVTQIVRARHTLGSEVESSTEQLTSRSPIDRNR
jgi:hypothetical protein